MGTAITLSLILAVHITSLAQQPAQTQGAVELTQGPVHEAFGEPIVFNPQPGPIIPKKPPEPVDELPNDQRPQGENVIWIPGYWFWDDQRQDFIWVSGFWRVPPPNRYWVPGYWADTGNGYQWVAGFWADASSSEAEYLPQPPESLEAGPSTAAPNDDSIWAPGCWVWLNNEYRWTPGYWTQAYPDWVWNPSHYVWTPSGYLFAGGYWDYPSDRRGVLFAPVYFPPGYLGNQANFVYTPSLVLDTTAIINSLFVRPNYHHYYFGDYYAAENLKAGYYPAFSYHNSRLGYDSVFAHSAWARGREDKNWFNAERAQYWNRREHPEARPARTYAAFQEAARGASGGRIEPVARRLNEVVTQHNGAFKFQKVDAQRLHEDVSHATHSRTVVQQRATFEQKNVVRPVPKVEPKLAPKAPPEIRSPRWEMPRPKSPAIAPKALAHAPPALPQIPAHHPEPPKVRQPLPHPEEALRHTAAPPPPPKKK